MAKKQFSIYEAKTQLSRLLKAVERGEEIVIARGDTPVAKIVRFDPPHLERQAGLSKGKIWVSDDFNDPLGDFKEYQ